MKPERLILGGSVSRGLYRYKVTIFRMLMWTLLGVLLGFVLWRIFLA
jgi:hypothetical protein